jgi:mRNA interferase RelE/StbE
MAKRIVKAIDALCEVEDPKRYIKKLKGSFGVPLYSFRVGDYRVILNVSEDVLAIYVVDVGDRSAVYRNY